MFDNIMGGKSDVFLMENVNKCFLINFFDVRFHFQFVPGL